MKYLMICFALLSFSLMACGGDDATPAAPPAEAAQVSTLSFVTTSTNISAEENRYVITVWEGGSYFSDIAAMTVTAHDPNQAGHPAVWQGEAVGYTDYAIPYWVVYPPFDAQGLWQLDIAVTLNSGEVIQGALVANVEEPPASILPGMAAPPSDTLTFDDGLPIVMMTTDPTPNEALYQLSIAEALENDKPSVVIFATPGLCTNFICAPVLDASIDPIYAAYQDDFNIIHVEVYDLTANEYVPAMGEWGLNYEPWTYLIDTDGMVVARYDGPISLTELRDQLNALIS